MRQTLHLVALLAALATNAISSSIAVAAERTYAPDEVLRNADSLVGRVIEVKGRFTMVMGFITLTGSDAEYLNHLRFDLWKEFLPVERTATIWNFRERYEGAIVVIRGQIKPAVCFRIVRTSRCDDTSPSIVPDSIRIASPDKPAFTSKDVDLPPLDETSTEMPALRELARQFIGVIGSAHESALLTLLAPTAHRIFAPDTFQYELGESAADTPQKVADLYEQLMADKDGRGRWLFFSEEAAIGGNRLAEFKVFTEYYPAHEPTEAVICLSRQRSTANRWPRTIFEIETPSTRDPYACYRTRKIDGRWWIDFERAYLAAGRSVARAQNLR